jgi:hypothetical protein
MDDALTTVQSAQTPAAATTTDITNYNAYAADEIANGRTPLSRLAYEQAAKPTTSTNINVNTTDGEELPAAWAKAEQTLAQKGQAFKRIRNAAGQLEVYIGPEGLPEIITIPGGEISQTTAASAQEAVLQAQNAFANKRSQHKRDRSSCGQRSATRCDPREHYRTFGHNNTAWRKCLTSPLTAQLF